MNGFKRTLLLFAIAIVVFGCSLTEPALTGIIFQSAVQTGGTSGTTDSTALTLSFDVDPVTLAASDITLTGATRGVLSGTGTTRSLAVRLQDMGNTKPSGHR